MLLKGKTAIVTGASRGIGEAIARRFAEEGADVAFTYLSSEDRARNLENSLNQLQVRTKAYRADAASFQTSEIFVDEVIRDFGKIDVLVNNAGVTRDNLLLRMTEEQWDEVMRTNLKSVYVMTKHVMRHMLKAKSGSIINISSVVGVSGNAGQSNYAASKAGILGFTKSIAEEIGSRSIRCNAIAPGFIESDMTAQLSEEVRKQYWRDIPMNRFGQPNEVGDACVFLASDLSRYITGQTLNVCGGLLT
jgi:3-oxoacyl-[acyl-carrier protein] reductase